MLKACSVGLFVCALLIAAEKKPPQGSVENDNLSIAATILGTDQVKQAVGSDFGNGYTVLQIRVTPKGGKEVAIHLDDFLLRSVSDGDHSGPLVASQIAGDGALVVSRTYAPRTSPDSPQPLAGTKVEMKSGGGQSDVLEALKKQILAEKTISEPESGLLFFPLEKEKAKNLVLTYTTAEGKLRMQFK